MTAVADPSVGWVQSQAVDRWMHVGYIKKDWTTPPLVTGVVDAVIAHRWWFVDDRTEGSALHSGPEGVSEPCLHVGARERERVAAASRFSEKSAAAKEERRRADR